MSKFSTLLAILIISTLPLSRASADDYMSGLAAWPKPNMGYSEHRDGRQNSDQHPHFEVFFSSKYEIICPVDFGESPDEEYVEILLKGFETELKPATWWRSAQTKFTPAANFLRYLGAGQYTNFAVKEDFKLEVRLGKNRKIEQVGFRVPSEMFKGFFEQLFEGSSGYITLHNDITARLSLRSRQDEPYNLHYEFTGDGFVNKDSVIYLFSTSLYDHCASKSR